MNVEMDISRTPSPADDIDAYHGTQQQQPQEPFALMASELNRMSVEDRTHVFEVRIAALDHLVTSFRFSLDSRRPVLNRKFTEWLHFPRKRVQ
jgi:hypothetical protein